MTTTTNDAELRDIAALSAAIRFREQEIVMLAEKRRKAVRRHHANGVTYATMAKAMGISDVATYKILRGKDGPLRAPKESLTN